MPLYEFECDVCGHRFERIQKFSDPNPDACPKCGGAVQKLLSSPAIQFKGSGFYLTDYGRGTGSKTDSANVKSGKNDSGATSSDSSKADSGSSTKSDSAGSTSSGGDSAAAKPAATTTTKAD